MMRKAAIVIQTWVRMRLARRRYFVDLAEAKEQAKMENQLEALKRRLEEEAKEREKMAADNLALQERLAQAAKSGSPAPSAATSPSAENAAENAPAIKEGSIVIDQSILDESGQMLAFLQKENAKYRAENANLHREVRPDEMRVLGNGPDVPSCSPNHKSPPRTGR